MNGYQSIPGVKAGGGTGYGGTGAPAPNPGGPGFPNGPGFWTRVVLRSAAPGSGRRGDSRGGRRTNPSGY